MDKDTIWNFQPKVKNKMFVSLDDLLFTFFDLNEYPVANIEKVMQAYKNEIERNFEIRKREPIHL